MSVLRVGQGSSEATTVTIPAGHQAGDLLIIFAHNDGSTTNPTVPAGWTTVNNSVDGGGAGSSASVGWKIAMSASETSGTWTGATGCVVVVLRNTDDLSPVITSVATGGFSQTLTYSALTEALLLGVNTYLLAFGACRSTDTTIDTPPSGLTNIVSALGATQDMAAHEGVNKITWPSTNVSIGGTLSDTISFVMAIRASRLRDSNYLHARSDVSNTGIISMSERTR